MEKPSCGSADEDGGRIWPALRWFQADFPSVPRGVSPKSAVDYPVAMGIILPPVGAGVGPVGARLCGDRDMGTQTLSQNAVTVETASVACDGGGGTLGHPKVYLSLAKGHTACPWCGQAFVLKAGARVAGH